MAKKEKKGKKGENLQRKKPENAAKKEPVPPAATKEPVPPAAMGKPGDLWQRGITYANSPVGKALAATMVTVLFLGTAAMVAVYVQNYKKHLQELSAKQKIRDFADAYYSKGQDLTDYEKFAKVANLSDHFVNLTLLNEELQLEIEDIRQKLTSGWRVFRWSIYLFSKDKASWQDAVNKCEEHNTNLASISHREEEIYLDTQARNGKIPYWIGVRKKHKKPHGVEWISGADATATYWDSSAGQPDAETGEDCILITNVCPVLSCWHDYPCFLKTNYVCKKSPDPRFLGAMP